MTAWEEFEAECTKHLNAQYSEYASFSHQGLHDSTTPDILVEIKTGDNFYIEVKKTPAQCGQFVLFPDADSETFLYSSRNVSELNSQSQLIINHMNENFEEYSTAGTAGKTVTVTNASEIASEWIVNYYKQKNVKFIITNDYVILPIEKFSDFFETSIKFRAKRSGSAKIGASKIDHVLPYVRQQRNISHYRTTKDRVYVKSETLTNGQKFTHGEQEFVYSQQEDFFEIRKLSQTNNSNVIFSIKQKAKLAGLNQSQFVTELTA